MIWHFAFNIIFTDKFEGDVVFGISMKSKRDEIISKLGKPQFLDNELGVFVYKYEKFYIFFVGSDQIQNVSVYKRVKEHYTVKDALSAFEELQLRIDETITSCKLFAYMHALAASIRKKQEVIFHSLLSKTRRKCITEHSSD